MANTNNTSLSFDQLNTDVLLGISDWLNFEDVFYFIEMDKRFREPAIIHHFKRKFHIHEKVIYLEGDNERSRAFVIRGNTLYINKLSKVFKFLRICGQIITKLIITTITTIEIKSTK